MVSKITALTSMTPAPNTPLFQPLQGTAYQTAVLKSGVIFDSLTKQVSTKHGDQALVVATPKDGNCLPTAMLRGLVNNGYPLSPGIEQQAMSELRGILGDSIANHQWPHDLVAHPQTLEECIHDTRTNGRWCGELAIVSLAAVAGVECHLWRYPSDNKELNIIEPLMSPINPGHGDGRLVIHLLQTRHPLPDKPEHGSHWESVIMKPILPSVTPTLLTYTTSAPIHMDKDEHHYSFIQDNTKVPPLVIKVGEMVTFRGRGTASPYIRYVHQIRRKQGIAHHYQLMVCPLTASGKGAKWCLSGKRLTDVLSTRSATGEETKNYKLLLSMHSHSSSFNNHSASTIDLATEPRSVAGNSTPRVEKRSRTQTTLFKSPAPVISTPKKSSPKKKSKPSDKVTDAVPVPMTLPEHDHEPPPVLSDPKVKTVLQPKISIKGPPAAVSNAKKDVSSNEARIRELEEELKAARAIQVSRSTHSEPPPSPVYASFLTGTSSSSSSSSLSSLPVAPLHLQPVSRMSFSPHHSMYTMSPPSAVSPFDTMTLLSRHEITEHMRMLHTTIDSQRRYNEYLSNQLMKFVP